MTGIAVLCFRRNPRIGVMTCEANSVTVWNRFKRTLFQPKTVSEIFRSFSYVFLAGISLRLISSVTYRTTRRRFLLLLFLEGRIHEPASISTCVGKSQTSHNIDMLIVRKTNCELRNEFASLQFRIRNIAETRKKPTSCFSRRTWPAGSSSRAPRARTR